MRKYIADFLKTLSFEKEYSDILLSNYEKLEKQAQKPLFDLIASYKSLNYVTCKNLEDTAKEIAAAANIHEYTASLIVAVCLTEHMHELYKERGISDDIWLDSVADIKYKTEECMLVKNVCGVFVLHWFDKFYNLERFCIGRLQFELSTLGEQYEKNGICYPADTKVLRFHIPRSLKPLTAESVDSAFAAARVFFDMPHALFTCNSWLLYQGFEGVFKLGSNLDSFRKRFDILCSKTEPAGQYSDMWRLFDMDYTGNINDYPESSSLHRNMKQYLLNGGATGTSYGVTQ